LWRSMIIHTVWMFPFSHYSLLGPNILFSILFSNTPTSTHIFPSGSGNKYHTHRWSNALIKLPFFKRTVLKQWSCFFVMMLWIFITAEQFSII